jgi:hypothetical protein
MKTRTIGQCKDCKWFKSLTSENYLGDCSNKSVYGDGIYAKYCDEFLIAEDFGCWHWKEKKCETK